MIADVRDDLLLLRVGGMRLAVPAIGCDPLPEPVRPVIGADGSIPALFPHAGHAFILVDLRTKFGLPATAGSGRVILAQIGGQRRAFLVDEVLGPFRESEARAAPLPNQVPAQYFAKALIVGDQLALRTDLERLLALEPEDALSRFAEQNEVPPAGAASSSDVVAHVPLDQALTRVTAELRGPDARASVKLAPAEGVRPKPAPLCARTPAGSHQESPADNLETAGTVAAPPVQPVIYPESLEKTARAWVETSPRLRGWPFALLLLAGVTAATLATRHSARQETSPAVQAQTAPIPEISGKKTSPKAPAPKVPKESTHPPRSIDLVFEGKGASTKIIIHKVQPGDTLWAIAAKYIHDPWAYRQIAEQNGIANPDAIEPGDEVRIILRGKR